MPWLLALAAGFDDLLATQVSGAPEAGGLSQAEG